MENFVKIENGLDYLNCTLINLHFLINNLKIKFPYNIYIKKIF